MLITIYPPLKKEYLKDDKHYMAVTDTSTKNTVPAVIPGLHMQKIGRVSALLRIRGMVYGR